jgi:hypothetical protein
MSCIGKAISRSAGNEPVWDFWKSVREQTLLNRAVDKGNVSCGESWKRDVTHMM